MEEKAIISTQNTNLKNIYQINDVYEYGAQYFYKDTKCVEVSTLTREEIKGFTNDQLLHLANLNNEFHEIIKTEIKERGIQQPKKASKSNLRLQGLKQFITGKTTNNNEQEKDTEKEKLRKELKLIPIKEMLGPFVPIDKTNS